MPGNHYSLQLLQRICGWQLLLASELQPVKAALWHELLAYRFFDNVCLAATSPEAATAPTAPATAAALGPREDLNRAPVPNPAAHSLPSADDMPMMNI